MKHFILILLMLFLTAHAPAQLAPESYKFLVMRNDSELPAGVRPLATVKGSVGEESGFEWAVEKVGMQARNKGGNAMLIREVKYGGVFRALITVVADVYRLDSVEQRVAGKRRTIDSIVGSVLPPNAGYSLLYVCRPSHTAGWIFPYTLRYGDSAVCRVKNGRKCVVQLYGRDRVTFWARTETRASLDMDVRPGHVYLLRCMLTTGIVVARPLLFRVSTYYGIEELMQHDFGT